MDFQLIWESLPALLKGATVTLWLSVLSLGIGILIALLLVLMRMVGGIILRSIVVAIVTIIRGIPLLIQLYLVYYGLPQMGIVFDAYTVGVAVLSLYMGAYLSEILRGAIQSIEHSQIEGAYALGLSFFQTMRIVVLPQAIRLTIPPTTNQFISIIKESALVSQITILELTLSAQRIISFTFQPVEIFMTIAIIYLIITMSFSRLTRWLEQITAIPGLELARQ